MVEEEADETLFWLELINERKLHNDSVILPLIKEADELTAIFTAIGKSSKKINPKSVSRIPKSGIKS